MRSVLALATALASATMLLPLSTQAAGSFSGQIDAKVTLQSGCIVAGAPGAGSSNVNFGTLNFGTVPAAFTGVLTATPTQGAGGSGGTQIQCSPDVSAISIAVSAGNNASKGADVGVGTRALAMGSSDFLPYEVYSDAGMTTPYPTDGSAQPHTLSSAGTAADLPIYGRINKTSPAALKSGTYNDVLLVTISW